jgi:two-component system CheB/CheR fusion protein
MDESEFIGGGPLAAHWRGGDAVEAERKRFYDVLETLPAYLVLLTPDYHVSFANRFFRERFGESHGLRCFEYLFGRNEPCEICETYTVLKTMTPHEWEWSGPDGRIYDVYDFPFIDTDGSTLIMETGFDITDRKRVEEDLRTHKEHLEEMVRERTSELESKNVQLAAEIEEHKRTAEALGRAKEDWERTFNSIPDMIAILDDQHRILRTNPAMARRLGCTPGQCVGLPCYSVMHGTDAPPSFCPHKKTLDDGREHTSEVHEERLGGDFLVSTTPIFDDQGRMTGSVHVARDVTEIKRAEERIQSLALFPEENPSPVLRASVDGTLRYANHSAAGLLEQWQCHVGEPLPEPVQKTLAAAAVNGRHQELEIRCGKSDLSLILVPIVERGYVNFYGRDLTGRKFAEKALQASEDDLNRAQVVAHIGSWRLDVMKNELLWSDEAHRIFGIPKETPMTYETFLGVVHPDDRAFVDQKWNGALLGLPYDIEHRIVVGGAVKWVRERAELELDEDGKVVGGFGITQDITAKKQTDEALRNSQARFRLLSETAGKLLRTKDPQGIVNELCRQVMSHLDCHAFFNFLVDENAGRLRLNVCAGIPEDEARKLEWLDYGVAVCGCVARDGVPMIAEDIFHNPSPLTELVKSYGIQAYACNPLKIEDRVMGTLSFGTRTRTHFTPDDLDLMKTVTDHVATAMERMNLIEELRRSRDGLEIRVNERTAELLKTNEALEQSNRDLEDFAHVSSHDLQEPLRKIQTFSDRLITGYQESLDDNALFYLQRMQHAAGRMQNLILDVLKHSRVRTSPEPFAMVNLKDTARESLSDLKVLREETQAEILIDELPVIEADPVQMRQLFQNLLENALKYRGEETPAIRVCSVREHSDEFCEIHIKDNGIGFDEQYLDRIFKPFKRLHGQSSSYPGTGMGLAICLRIVERHGGSITAKSLPGKGSTFIVKLPLRQESKKQR